MWPLIFSFSTCQISSKFWSLPTVDHCWVAMEKPVKYSWGHVFIWVTCSSGYHSLAGSHSTRARTAPCSGAPCYAAGENSLWAEVFFRPKRQFQHRNAKTVVSHLQTHCHTTLWSAFHHKTAGKFSALKWNTGWAVNASFLHHTTTIKCQKYLGATEVYTLFIQRDALGNTGSSLQDREKVEDERGQSLMKESSRR